MPARASGFKSRDGHAIPMETPAEGWRRRRSRKPVAVKRVGVRSSRSPREVPGLRPGFGMWRSLVAHLAGGQGAAGSNPVIPTRVGAPSGSLSGKHYRDVAQRCAKARRVPAIGAGGRGFESCRPGEGGQPMICPRGCAPPGGGPGTPLRGVDKQRRRGVAQLGRAPGLGPGSRRFKSCHPDDCGSDPRRNTGPMSPPDSGPESI